MDTDSVSTLYGLDGVELPDELLRGMAGGTLSKAEEREVMRFIQQAREDDPNSKDSWIEVFDGCAKKAHALGNIKLEVYFNDVNDAIRANWNE